MPETHGHVWIALSHCSRRGISDCIRGFIHVSRGLLAGASLHEGERQRPLRSWTGGPQSLWFAGTSSVSLATCPKRASRRLFIGTEIGGRPVLSEMVTFLTISCHLTPSMRLWARMWKTCRRSKLSVLKMVHVSKPYSRIGTIQVSWIRSLVASESFDCDHTLDIEFLEELAMPILRSKSGVHLPDESMTLPR